MEPSLRPKNLRAGVAVPPAPVRVPIQGHLPRKSCHSRLSANDKGDNEMMPGAVLRNPNICLTAEKTPGKSQLGDRLMRLCDQ